MSAGCQEKNPRFFGPGAVGAGRRGEVLPGYTWDRSGGVKGKWATRPGAFVPDETPFAAGTASRKTSTFPLTPGGKTAILRTDQVVP